MSERLWKIARHTLQLGSRTLVMGILNVTPDSFSDGGEFQNIERATAHAHAMIEEGADILDIGGESTRPGAEKVSVEEETRRVVPVIERLLKDQTVPISVDTTKREVARVALLAGAEIVNDISGLRFDPALAEEAAHHGAGLILMHSRGSGVNTLHGLEPVPDVMQEVEESLRRSIEEARGRGVEQDRIVLDPGVGFGKSQEQNLELIRRLDELARLFAEFPILIGTSRKSFLGRLLPNAPPAQERLHATMATVTASVLGGAHIVRVHDVRAAIETVRVADAIKSRSQSRKV